MAKARTALRSLATAMSISKLELVMTAALTIAAVATAGAAVARTFASPDTERRDTGGALTATPVPDSLLAAARALARSTGGSGARHEVLVFSDYECPGCKILHSHVEELRGDTSVSFSVGILHYPLAYHRFARPTARIAECAAKAGAFGRMNEVLFSIQDSLGLLPWDAVVSRAVGDGGRAVNECMSNEGTRLDARIDSILRLADLVGVRATPTVVVDGKLLSRPPSLAELRSALATGERRQ